LGAWLKITGFLIPEADLAGTVPSGLSGSVAVLPGAGAKGGIAHARALSPFGMRFK
jgi:hypothetical protein